MRWAYCLVRWISQTGPHIRSAAGGAGSLCIALWRRSLVMRFRPRSPYSADQVSWGGSDLTLRTRLTNSGHCPQSCFEISEYMEMAVIVWLGIDIVKQKFDVALNWNT